MTGTIIRFPTNRVVRSRWYRPSDNPDRAALDAALDSLNHARKALICQERSLLMQLHHMLRRGGVRS